MTLVAPGEGAVARDAPKGLGARALERASTFAQRREWALLMVIAAVGAVARLGFSKGTLFRDDAWVASPPGGSATSPRESMG